MSNIEQIKKEIQSITGAMIEIGLCVDQNYPSEKTYPGLEGAVAELSVSGSEEISSALRHRPYTEIYTSLKNNRAYNMRLIDGALIQFRYRFSKQALLKHVLAFYPSPDLLEYQNDPEIYELDILYADVIHKDIVTTPIRFDYDEAAFQEARHPKSHMTLGQYKNCRIAVLSALTPYRFINFILRAFYNTPFNEYCSDWKAIASDFPKSATSLETKDAHISFEITT